MAIKVTCSACSAVHSVNDRLAGREIRCPHCDVFIQVPRPSVVDVSESEEIVEVQVVEDEISDAVEIVESENIPAAVDVEIVGDAGYVDRSAAGTSRTSRARPQAVAPASGRCRRSAAASGSRP